MVVEPILPSCMMQEGGTPWNDWENCGNLEVSMQTLLFCSGEWEAYKRLYMDLENCLKVNRSAGELFWVLIYPLILQAKGTWCTQDVEVWLWSSWMIFFGQLYCHPMPNPLKLDGISRMVNSWTFFEGWVWDCTRSNHIPVKLQIWTCTFCANLSWADLDFDKSC